MQEPETFLFKVYTIFKSHNAYESKESFTHLLQHKLETMNPQGNFHLICG